ncbi:hypothetical protein LR48_Vigan05g071200 [Vigna angularis]|uniref:Uncharacterized protein n=1 Tax=Phaseolus angularis TaxID=3914 RepID=A0A0L9UK24_PHAAN|nr:hypothetical protein LR48_Vigan05g071200 [Vigna angularis]
MWAQLLADVRAELASFSSQPRNPPQPSHLCISTKESCDVSPQNASPTIDADDELFNDNALQFLVALAQGQEDMNESLQQPSQPPQQIILEQLGVLEVKISLSSIELQMPPEGTNKTSLLSFFICQRDIFEILSSTDMLCISVLQLWLLLVGIVFGLVEKLAALARERGGGSLECRIHDSDWRILKVSEKKAKDWCASKGNIPYFETSAKEDFNVDAAFLCIAKAALANEHEQDM